MISINKHLKKYKINMTIIISIISFIIGVALGIKLVFFSIKMKEKQEILKNENIFLNILKNKSSLKFIQRLHDYVQLTSDNYTLYYMINSKEFSIFDGDQYLADSSKIKKSIKNKLLDYINKNFNNEININVSDIGGYIISNNSIIFNGFEINDVNESIKDTPLNLDEILDKINTDGISSLSKNELDFLNSFKNKK